MGSDICKPIYKEVPYIEAIVYAHHFYQKPNFVFLDSAQGHATLGRFSFIAFDPFATLTYRENTIDFNGQVLEEADIFDVLAQKIKDWPLVSHPHLPPFQGGVAGFFSYDLARDLEHWPAHAIDDQHYPKLAVGFYDLVLAFDHVQSKAWLFSSGFPEQRPAARQQRAQERMSSCLQQIDTISKHCSKPIRHNPIVIDPASIQSNFTQEQYLNVVAQAREHILAGDIFEINLSQRFHCILPQLLLPFDLYSRIRVVNPAPFSAFAHFDDTVIVSSSPERFLKLSHGKVETRPIKGTRPRAYNPVEDYCLGQQLLTSLKDRAENTMIVDLMRNDLSRVCRPHSVQVPQYCGLESYKSVHHLVSVVEGQLDARYHAVDLLKATFPGGSITGAPKIQAMKIIDQLEPTQRGPYCGSMGYMGFDGGMDTSILIRTYVIKNQVITFQAGGAVVLDSDPKAEYEETLVKANALKLALTKPLVEETQILYDFSAG